MYQSFGVFVWSAPFGLRNITGQNGAKNTRPTASVPEQEGLPSTGDTTARRPPCPPHLVGPPGDGHTHNTGPATLRPQASAILAGVSFPAIEKMASRPQLPDNVSGPKAFFGGKGRRRPKRGQGFSMGLRGSGLAFLSAGDGCRQPPTLPLLPFPRSLPMAPYPPPRPPLPLPLSALAFAFPVWAEEVWTCDATVPQRLWRASWRRLSQCQRL